MDGFDDRRIWAVTFAVFLTFALATSVLGLAPVRFESGANVDNPGAPGSRWLDEEYYRSVDAQLVEINALRGLGVRTRAFVDYELFGDSTSEFVVVGQDSSLFWALYVDVECEDVTGFERLVDLEPGANDVRYMVLSPKSEFLIDKLDRRDRPPQCIHDARSLRHAHMTNDPLAIDVYPLLRDEIASNTEVFFEYDTHWNSRGRVLVAEQIVEAYAPGLWDAEALVRTDVEHLQGLARVIGFGLAPTVPGHVVERGEVEIVDNVVSPTLGTTLFYRSRSSSDDVIAGTTLIVGDSQMANLLPLLSGYFEDLVFTSYLRLERNPAVREIEADRVLLETVESQLTANLSTEAIDHLLSRYEN